MVSDGKENGEEQRVSTVLFDLSGLGRGVGPSYHFPSFVLGQFSTGICKHEIFLSVGIIHMFSKELQ